MNERQVSTLRRLYNATVGENWEHRQGSFESLDGLIDFMSSAARGSPEGLELNGIYANSGGDGYTIAWTGNGPYGAAHAQFIATVHEWMPQILVALERSLETMASPAAESETP